MDVIQIVEGIIEFIRKYAVFNNFFFFKLNTDKDYIFVKLFAGLRKEKKNLYIIF